MGERMRELVSEGAFCKQYVIDWTDLVQLGAVNNVDVALVEDVPPPEWLIVEDAFLDVNQTFEGAGITAFTLELNLEQVPSPIGLLVQTDILSAAGPAGLGGAEKGTALVVTGGEGKPTALMYGGLTAVMRSTGANMEDLTQGKVTVYVLGRKAINLETLEATPLP
jgi:hypothetical protein